MGYNKFLVFGAVFIVLFVAIGLWLYKSPVKIRFTQKTRPIGDDTFVYETEVDWLRKYDLESYVIALPERLDSIKETLGGLGIKPHIYNAFHKSRISKERNKLIEANYITKNCSLNDGRIACHISHTKVLRDFLRRKDGPKYVLIFEDDLMTPYTKEELQARFDKAFAELEALPTEWEYVNLGRCWADCSKDIEHGDIIYKSKRPLCRHSYIVSRAGARKIIEGTLPMTAYPGDNLLANIIDSNHLNGFVTKPSLFKQNRGKFGSNLGNNSKVQRECIPVHQMVLPLAVSSFSSTVSLSPAVLSMNTLTGIR
uniref:Glycosyl transferase family 25 domain-containing protein n=1 Tax=viral metagenome TaxID=1070528 RepID=A0A6C0KAD0_9ZZZZ